MGVGERTWNFNEKRPCGEAGLMGGGGVGLRLVSRYAAATGAIAQLTTGPRWHMLISVVLYMHFMLFIKLKMMTWLSRSLK